MAAPRLKTQVPGWYRFMVGELECTVVWDGYIHHAYDGLFPNGDPAEIRRLQDEHLLPHDHIPMDLNPVVVNDGTRLFIIDVGMGTRRPLFGDQMGRMLENLAASGIAPEQVDVVLMTHLHPDHSFGLIHADGSAVFPNAELCASSVDWEEWTNERNLGRNDFRGVWTEGTLEAVSPYRRRLKLVNPGDAPYPGVSVLSGAGHSGGQVSFLFESGGEKVIFTGDLAHHHVFDPHHPEWFFHNDYDTDPPLGAESKDRIFSAAADGGIRFHGYHFPYPGLGLIVREGDGCFRFVPDVATPRLGPGRFGTG